MSCSAAAVLDQKRTFTKEPTTTLLPSWSVPYSCLVSKPETALDNGLGHSCMGRSLPVSGSMASSGLECRIARSSVSTCDSDRSLTALARSVRFTTASLTSSLVNSLAACWRAPLGE